MFQGNCQKPFQIAATGYTFQILTMAMYLIIVKVNSYYCKIKIFFDKHVFRFFVFTNSTEISTVNFQVLKKLRLFWKKPGSFGEKHPF